ncbi:Rhomboid-related protein 4 [Trichoplax sp. H2]|nr:Rhomboid-related protein 4 [Trichoplax sp. H2]|eukprot:RDD45696.1 Rhomboid-related protein 4 [Trichoplax sp. H2]
MVLRRRGNNFGLLLLLANLFHVGLDRIPPITLATIGLNSILFMNLLPDYRLPHLSEVCISVKSVWYMNEWQRLILGAFFHASDMHLYYNMVSFLWKGIHLEKKYGSLHFLSMIISFTALTNVTLVAISYAIGHHTDKLHYFTDCAVGFSGVIFALKVVATYVSPPSTNYIMNLIPISSRYACWAELVLIQVLVPNSSFLGHLAGILVGLAYVKTPIGSILDSIFSIVTGSRGSSNRRHRQRFQSSGVTGYRMQTPSHADNVNNVSGPSYPGSRRPQYEPINDDDDPEFQQAIQASLQESHHNRPIATAPPLLVQDDIHRTYPQPSQMPNSNDVDKVREARLARFQRSR